VVCVRYGWLLCRFAEVLVGEGIETMTTYFVGIALGLFIGIPLVIWFLGLVQSDDEILANEPTPASSIPGCMTVLKLFVFVVCIFAVVYQFILR
jgi:Sec-independent protein secretion pathway component TatC